jgi:hypothetical protein
MDLLGLKGFYETLNIGILIGIAFAAHADVKTMSHKLFDIVTRSVLDTAV